MRPRAAATYPHTTVILLAGLALAACGPSQPTPEETTLTAVGQAAPDFTVTTLAGDQFRLYDQRGRVVVINFFATWCPPCREEMPHLEREVWGRFRGPSFALLALGREHNADELQPFVEESGLTFPIAPDPERAVYGRYAETFIPRTVVVGPDGVILFQSSGFERNEFDRMVQVIEAAMSGLETAAPATPGKT